MAALQQLDGTEQLQRLDHAPTVAELAEAHQSDLEVLAGACEVLTADPGERADLAAGGGGPAALPARLGARGWPRPPRPSARPRRRRARPAPGPLVPAWRPGRRRWGCRSGWRRPAGTGPGRGPDPGPPQAGRVRPQGSGLPPRRDRPGAETSPGTRSAAPRAQPRHGPGAPAARPADCLDPR